MVGGGSKCQSIRGKKKDKPKNPKINTSFRHYKTTQQSHFIQGYLNMEFNDWPEIFKNFFCGTFIVPTAWNQAIDRSIDNVQEIYIKKMNTGAIIDQNFVKKYISDVQKRIIMDNELKNRDGKKVPSRKFLYREMDQKDVQYQLDRFDEMENNPTFIGKIVRDEALATYETSCV